MKIGWVNDYEPNSMTGGSLLTQMRAVECAPEWAHIEWCSPVRLNMDCDLYVVNNHSAFDEEQIEFLTNVPHVYWSHDVTLSVDQVRTGALVRLVTSSKRVVFLSPLHRDVFLRNFGIREVGMRRIKLAPAMVEPAKFDMACHSETVRDRDAIWLGTFERHRGLRSAIEWAKTEGTVLDVYGIGIAPTYVRHMDACRLMGELAPNDVAKTMARYRRLVTFPLEVDRPDGQPAYCEACGRVAIEARLAGLEVVHNDRLGVDSWPWFKSRDATYAAMQAAPAQFWQVIGAVTGEGDGE